LRALVVGDNATNRLILHHQLSAWGIHSDIVDDNALVVTALRTQALIRPYDVAILDLSVPGRDGVALARQIREDPAISDTRLLVMSSAGKRADFESRVPNLDCWLTKPVKRTKLHEAMVSLVNHKSGVSRLSDWKEEGDFNPAGGAGRNGRISRTPAEPIAALQKKTRVLVADDNVVNQKVALLQLKKIGFSGDAVSNGLEVIKALEQVPYQIVLMDCQMPEMDGYAATVEIRRRQLGKHRTVIIAMTARALEDDRDKCLSAGMDDYISKPVKMEELEEVLLKWMPTALGVNGTSSAASNSGSTTTSQLTSLDRSVA
jgi:hypothetical protein